MVYWWYYVNEWYIEGKHINRIYVSVYGLEIPFYFS
jgi:hypothetical protein